MFYTLEIDDLNVILLYWIVEKRQREGRYQIPTVEMNADGNSMRCGIDAAVRAPSTLWTFLSSWWRLGNCRDPASDRFKCQEMNTLASPCQSSLNQWLINTQLPHLMGETVLLCVSVLCGLLCLPEHHVHIPCPVFLNLPDKRLGLESSSQDLLLGRHALS